MDGFETIRRRASALHDKLIDEGVDGSDMMQLVEAAVGLLELELVFLPPGNAALKNSKALYDEQSDMICCEDVGSAADRALLVAHEIGHAELHAGSSHCDSEDINPSLSLETAPVGLQRVEDYGAKERRELQANVFAREMLLPRVSARRQHIEDGLTARDIAARTGLDLAVVRQQLFDALLLPEQNEAAIESKTYVPIKDESQDRAVDHRDAPFQLQAGPGTGKTRTLIKRIESLIAEGHDPASILVMTFSNRAAGELTERLAERLPEAAAKIWVGTFHAFGLDLVRRYYDLLDLSPNPALFDRSDAISVLEDILPTLPLVHYRNLWDPAMVLREMIGAFSRAKDELVDPVRYRALAETMLADAGDDETKIMAAEKCLEIAQVYELYEQAIRKKGAVDFGDLIMRPTLLLESNEAVRVQCQLRHRHILVDEYQDVNRASARMLKAIAGHGQRLWVVGDARQSIYRFRGASSANMAKFADDYPGAMIDQLEINYRSSTQIVNAFASIAPRMGASEGMLELALTPHSGAGPSNPMLSSFETEADEEAGIAAAIEALKANDVVYRDQAVLCRSNRRLGEIAAALEARGIPVLHLGSLFERSDIRDLLSLLSLATDPFGDALVRIGVMPRYGLSLQDVYIVTHHIRAQDESALEILPSLAALGGLSTEGVAGLMRLAEDFEGISLDTSPWELLSTYILDRTEFARDISRATDITQQMRAVAIWQFLNFVREQSHFGSGKPIERALDRVRQMVLLAEERDLRQVPASALHLDAVRLMTVHGSKGLEFEAVHVPGLSVASFPLSFRGQRCPPPIGMIDGDDGLSISDAAKRAHVTEEECLFFVAMSRAKQHLRLYRTTKQKGGNNRNPSPLLGWIAPANLQVDNVLERMPLPSGIEKDGPVDVTLRAEWRLTETRLTSYQKCPKRFFYTHILGLGAARKQTPFTMTHDCLYELLYWLRRERLTTNPDLSTTYVAFDEIWARRGPHDHAFADDYFALARRLVLAAFQSGDGLSFVESGSQEVSFQNGVVHVTPTEQARSPGGDQMIRRVRTGYRRKKEFDDWSYTLYILAARSAGLGDASVRALHLTDEIEEPVSLTPRMIDNRVAKMEMLLGGIAAGQFPTIIDPVTCPRCPHFFICAATPAGPIAQS